MEDSKCFIGPRKVNKLEVVGAKTYAGTEILKVVYEGGYSQFLTQKTFNIVKTSEPKDYNYIRDTKYNVLFKELYPLVGKHFMSYGEDLSVEEKSKNRNGILSEMLSLACEYDLTVTEIEGVLNTLTAEANNLFSGLGYQCDNAYDRASNYLWSKDDSTFIPGYDSSNDYTLSMAKMVIDTIPKKEELKENESTGDTKE